jgi:phosphatidylserine/phosphatidylglycerophosphate/cardiolipin synthase-like enzyme
MTAIQNFKGNSTENRGNEKVTIWIQEETSKAVSTSQKPFFNSGENGILERIAEMFQTAKETIMITTPRIDDVLKDELLQAARSGVRIYVLLDADGFDAWTRNGDAQMAENILCRQSSHALPSLVLVDAERPNAQGLLMQQSTPLDRALRVQDIAWGLELNSEQTKMQAHYASWLFWSTRGARKETRVFAHLKITSRH